MKTRLLTVFATLAITCFSLAGSKGKITDINAALAAAKAENKMLFLEFGREDCENCQALRAMLTNHQVSLPASKYVYADVNCDDPATVAVFSKKFHVSGRELPYVVVAAPDGTLLASRTGPGTPADFLKVIQAAEKKAAKNR